MKKNKFFFLFLILLTSGCALKLYTPKPILDLSRMQAASSFLSDKYPLPINEKLIYDIKWIGIPVGTLTSSIKGIESINGRDAYVLEAVFKTNSFWSSFYAVDDRFVSYMDKEKLYTLRHEVYRSEGKYRKDAITEFDHINKQARFRNLLDNTEKVFEIPEGVHDFLSAYYYFRLLSLREGDKVAYVVSNNEKNYQLVVSVESLQTINLGVLGKKPALFVQPYALLDGNVIKEGRACGYYSPEGNRYMLAAVVSAPVLTKVSASLSKIESN